MREILFRGKTRDGRWAEGFLFKLSNDNYSWCIGIEPLSANDYGEIYDMSYDEVIPETVGQYVWKHDVKGNRVFNGDIVKTKHNNLVIIKPSGAGYAPYRNKDGDYTKITNWGCVESGEVIGNVHDKEHENERNTFPRKAGR